MSNQQLITILGSTGSIGRNAVNIIKESGGRFKVKAISAYKNVELLAQQAKELNAEIAVIKQDALYGDLKELLEGTGIKAMSGSKAELEVASIPVDICLVAIVGSAAIEPTFVATKSAKKIALANKESLVCAGQLITESAKKHGCKIIPVDSEHSAIFQVFEQENAHSIEKIIITASGGPFRTWDKKDLASARLDDALKHPNWAMGAKITVDSATLMNKGLEIIEANRLFNLSEDKIEVIVHPESVIHSMVCYEDGSTLAQLGIPDMATPIAYALSYPDRMHVNMKRLNFAELKSLNFEELDNDKFEAPELARAALREGGIAPIVLNAANEIAVMNFLKKKIRFVDIVPIIKETINKFNGEEPQNIEEVIGIDNLARLIASEITTRKVIAEAVLT